MAVDNDDGCFISFALIKICPCSYQCESCSIENIDIDDHQWIESRSSIQSWSLFDQSRWRSMQYFGKWSSLSFSLVDLDRFRIGILNTYVVFMAWWTFRRFKVHWSDWMILELILSILRVWQFNQVKHARSMCSPSLWRRKWIIAMEVCRCFSLSSIFFNHSCGFTASESNVSIGRLSGE